MLGDLATCLCQDDSRGRPSFQIHNTKTQSGKNVERNIEETNLERRMACVPQKALGNAQSGGDLALAVPVFGEKLNEAKRMQWRTQWRMRIQKRCKHETRVVKCSEF